MPEYRLVGVALSILLFTQSIGSTKNAVNGIHAIVEMSQGCLIGGDLNGDGVMEVVFHSGYYEGSESYVIDIKRNKATAVLECLCNI